MHLPKDHRFGWVASKEETQESAEKLMTISRKTDLHEYIIGKSEDVYRSKKTEPLAKAAKLYDLPTKYSEPNFAFGISTKQPGATNNIFPAGKFKIDDRDYSLKEITKPTDRNYNWPESMGKDHRFGGSSKSASKPQLGEEFVGDRVPGDSPIVLDANVTHVKELRSESYKRSRTDSLGKARPSGGRQKLLGPDHVYGGSAQIETIGQETFSGPQWGVRECIFGGLEAKKPEVDKTLGKTCLTQNNDHIPKDSVFGHPPLPYIPAAEILRPRGKLGKKGDEPKKSIQELRDIFLKAGITVEETDEEITAALKGRLTINALMEFVNRKL